MHISNVSVASLSPQIQSTANGVLAGASFGAQLTGQNLPTTGASRLTTSSVAPSPGGACA